MKTKIIKPISVRFLQMANQRCCPECGSRMGEIERHNEGRNLFIWYKCSSGNCDGQWLQKSTAYN